MAKLLSSYENLNIKIIHFIVSVIILVIFLATITSAIYPSLANLKKPATLTKAATTINVLNQKPSPTSSFNSKICMGQHFDFVNTLWYPNVNEIKTRLLESKVKCIRGMPVNGYTPAGYLDSLFQFYKDNGIRVSASIDATSTVYAGYNASETDLDNQIAAVAARQQQYGVIYAIEAPNEPDLFWTGKGVSYKGLGAKNPSMPNPDPCRGENPGDPAACALIPQSTKDSDTRSVNEKKRDVIKGSFLHQQDLYNKVKANPVLKDLIIMSPSITNSLQGAFVREGDPLFAVNQGAFEPYIDWANVHPYPGILFDDFPLNYAGINDYWNNVIQPDLRINPHAGTHYYSTDSHVNVEIANYYYGKNKPRVITEMGIQTTMPTCDDSSVSNKCNYNYQTSYNVQKKYIPRMFFESDRLGFKETQYYTFHDDENTIFLPCKVGSPVTATFAPTGEVKTIPCQQWNSWDGRAWIYPETFIPPSIATYSVNISLTNPYTNLVENSVKTMINGNREYFGLFEKDMKPKPSYFAFKDMMDIMNDSGTNSTLPPLSYSVDVDMPTGYNRLDFIHQKLYQKTNGTYQLAIWHEIANNRRDIGELNHPNIPSKLNLPANFNFKVNTFGANGQRVENSGGIGNFLNFEITDQVTIIDFEPVISSSSSSSSSLSLSSSTSLSNPFNSANSIFSSTTSSLNSSLAASSSVQQISLTSSSSSSSSSSQLNLISSNQSSLKNKTSSLTNLIISDTKSVDTIKNEKLPRTGNENIFNIIWLFIISTIGYSISIKR